jgi:hypothetical protein
MAHIERKNGKPTGRFIARVRLTGHKMFKRVFADWDEAKDYERYVRRHGKEPAASWRPA